MIEDKNFSGKECILFDGLDINSVNKLKETRTFLSLKKGECLYAEGNSPTGVYCIHEGHIKAFEIGTDGKEQIIYLGKPGDLVGWQQLTCDDAYSTTAVALEKVVASHMPKNVFIQIVQNSPLSLSLTKYICDDIIMLESKVLELSQKSVKERLATNIVILHEKFSEKCGEHTVISVPLTREDFANLIGTNTETVIKFLSELRKEGIIDYVEKKILILNLPVLKRIANMY